MHIWKDKEGNKLTPSEFMSRWKSGIQKVSAMDKVKMQLVFTYIIIFGVIFGLISTIIYKQWWLLVILIGALGLNCVSLLGIYQQYFVYKNINSLLKGVDMHENTELLAVEAETQKEVGTEQETQI